MSKVALSRRGLLAAVAGVAAVTMIAGCSGGSAGGNSSAGGEVTIEFAQWWEPELPAGSLRQMMDQFEQENPGIKVKLLSGPYASTKEQVVAGAAAGTMSDVVGLDGAWISDFAKQGSIADLTSSLEAAVMKIVQGIIDVVMGILTGNWERAGNGIKEILSGVWDTIVALVQGAWNILVR